MLSNSKLVGIVPCEVLVSHSLGHDLVFTYWGTLHSAPQPQVLRVLHWLGEVSLLFQCFQFFAVQLVLRATCCGQLAAGTGLLLPGTEFL